MILICQCKQAGLIKAESLEQICTGLEDAGVEYTLVDDLCGLAAEGHEVFSKWSDDPDLIVLACYPRAVEALFEAAGTKLPEKADIENLRIAEENDQLLERLIRQGQTGTVHQIQALKEWIPWFPVIDYNRCKNCKQCLSFCLFGVYEQDKSGMVRVVRPDQCKTNCPACSRVCPFAAIVFPKYHESPIQGDVVDEEQWKRRDVPDQLKQRLAGNVYSMLRNRSKSTVDGVDDLKKMQKSLGIPDDVIENLQKPNPKPEKS